MSKKASAKERVRRIKVIKRNLNLNEYKRYPNLDVSAELFELIAARFPQYQSSKQFLNLSRPIGHEDLDEFLGFLTSLGLKLQAHKADRHAQVRLVDVENITDAEIANAPFLECVLAAPQIVTAKMGLRDGETEPQIVVDQRLKKNRGRDFGSLWPYTNAIVVREAAKGRLEQANLRHLRFRLLATATDSKPWPDDIEPLYQVWSDLELPPVSCLLHDNDGQVFNSDVPQDSLSNGCFLLDGLKGYPSYQYDADQLSNVGPFDLAFTKERFGGTQLRQRSLICSQKAVLAFKELGMKLTLYPVSVHGGSRVTDKLG